MAFLFPSNEWLQALKVQLNQDKNYTQIAHKWEGDIMFHIEPDGPLNKAMYFYTDLWHGECRDAFIINEIEIKNYRPAYILSAPYNNFSMLLKGDLEPMQAMVTRKLKVKGSMAYMMRNVPIVLEFVRCAQDIDTEFLS